MYIYVKTVEDILLTVGYKFQGHVLGRKVDYSKGQDNDVYKYLKFFLVFKIFRKYKILFFILFFPGVNIAPYLKPITLLHSNFVFN